ncbi:MAG: hypothetical protein U0559_08365 [Anaerolineae bacterium]
MTPLLIAGATLAGRRWGPRISGWLIGFPLTSAPVSILLTLQYGPEFAMRAAIGNIAGLASICAFSLVYSFVAPTRHWAISAIVAALAFFAATIIWNSVSLGLLPTFAIVAVSIGLFLLIVPQQTIGAATTAAPRWDLPARMIIATLFVFTLTTVAPLLGAQLSGLLTPFPIFGTVLSAFAHRQQGAATAIQLLRGMALSLFGVAGFFLIVGSLLNTLGLVPTYVLATLVAFLSNGLALHLAQRSSPESENALTS